jgi:hypothetical protein
MHNEDLQYLHTWANIDQDDQIRNGEIDSHVGFMEMRNKCKMLIGKLEGKRKFKRRFM